jgi:pimeloyl-ACP methyl ester carboxylesterase
MKRATLAIHGIWTRARALAWIEVFEDMARYELDVRPREYGYASGVLSAFGWYRNRIVNAEENYVRRVLAREPEPNIIAHSFGGYVAWALMAERGVRFHNVILLAPAAPEATDWRRFEDKFNRVRVYWSPRDEIIGLAPYGRIGKVGALMTHPRVESIRTDRLHSEHIQPGRFKEYIEFLRQEAN